MSNRCAVNISKHSSGEGLKKELQQEASKKATSLSKLVSKIYSWAVNNQDKFDTDLKKAKNKPGEHISTSVSEAVRAELNKWAKKRETDRSLLCCFILEKALEDNLLKDVFLKEKFN